MTASPLAWQAVGVALDPGLRAEVLAGLRGTPKMLPPKLFYDARGAELFERICDLDDYYLTRAELSILRARASEIATLVGSDAALIEYGSGAGVKVRLLLDAMEQAGVPFAAYTPIDISREQLLRVSAEISSEYSRVPVLPVCADYTAPLSIPELPSRARRLAFFPGSTIGNFHPHEAAAFLRRVREVVGHDGALLLGVDRRKDSRVLDAAYDDREGVTAEFNLNALARLNREADADFDLDAFRHCALWNDGASRVEMHLVSSRNQSAHVAGESFSFARGESIWTESSYKYDRTRLERLVADGGFRTKRRWTDGGKRFWVTLLVAA